MRTLRLREITPDVPDKARQMDNAIKFECVDCEQKFAVVHPDTCFVDLSGPLLEVDLFCRRCGLRRKSLVTAENPRGRPLG